MYSCICGCHFFGLWFLSGTVRQHKVSAKAHHLTLFASEMSDQVHVIIGRISDMMVLVTIQISLQDNRTVKTLKPKIRNLSLRECTVESQTTTRLRTLIWPWLSDPTSQLKPLHNLLQSSIGSKSGRLSRYFIIFLYLLIHIFIF